MTAAPAQLAARRAGWPPLTDHTWLGLAAGAALASLAAGLAADVDAALAVAFFLGFTLLGMRAPMVLVLLLAGSAWFPLEHLVGSERSLPGDLSVSTMRLLGSGAGLALALVGMRDRLRAVAAELPRLLQTAAVLYALFLGWMTITLLWAPDRVEGLRELAKLGLPLLAGAVVACDPGRLGPARLARWIAFGLGLSLAIAFVYAAIGVNARALVPKEETGWVADVFGWAGNSPYALFAAFVGIVLLAMGEHGVVRRRIAFLGAAAAFVQIPFTLKRMAVGATGSAVTAMIAVGGVRRYLAPLGIVIAVLVILFFPPIQSRNVSEGGGVELEGRQYIWEQAIKRMDARDFVIGRGANAYFAESLAEDRPGGYRLLHSEPLRVVYETGAIGFVIGGGAFVTLLLGLFALIRSARPRTVERAAGEAAFGVATVYLLSGLTDNTLDNYLLGTTVWAMAGLAAMSVRKDA